MPENVDINVIAENLAELLTNSTNMASVFYDIFLNPVEMDVTLKQYNDENELVDVTIPNRAKDRRIALSGTGSPEGMVTANVGTCYVDSSASTVYFKISGSSNTGWTPALTADSIEDIITGLQQTIGLDGTEIVLMDTNGTVTSSVDLGAIGADKSLSNLNPTGNGVLAGKASVDLSNLTAMGEEHFANPSLSNLNSEGLTILGNKASIDLDNLSSVGQQLINGKVDSDFDNVSSTGIETSIGWTLPDYDNAIGIFSMPYTAPDNGWFIATGIWLGDWQSTNYVYVNGIAVATTGRWKTDWTTALNCQILVSKDDVITGAMGTMYFVPLKGTVTTRTVS